MNAKQRRTFAAVFAKPVPSGIEWAAIESLLMALGCTVMEGNGSRVRFTCRGVVASFHRPHPQKEAKQYQVRDARDFLDKIGARP